MSDDHSSANDSGKKPPFLEKITAGWQNLTKHPETVPPSKRFLITLVGLLGGLLLLSSVFFGICTLIMPSSEISHEEQVLKEAFAELDATLKIDNAKINKELMLIVDDMAASSQLMNKGVLPENDLALVMRNEFRMIGWEKNLPFLRRYVSRNPWQLGFLEIKSQMPMLTLADKNRLVIREMLDNPAVDMQLSYTLDQSGFALNEKDRNNLWGYVHLEEYELARALTGLSLQQIRESSEPPKELKANLPEALDALRYILKAAEIASYQKELNLRFDAMFIRENSLDTLKTLVEHPQFRLHNAKFLQEILEDQLANWPSDSPAFEGERTAGVWIYEQTRRGRLLELLAPQDVASLQELGSLIEVERAIKRNINADEIFYLTRMSEIVFLARKPYHERFQLLTRWEDELNAQRGDSNYPVLAGTVLLRDVRTVMYRLAIDRARTEAWALALGTSTRQPSKQINLHPMTGQPYRIRVMTDPNIRGKNTISINWLDSEEPITIPAFTADGAE